MDWRLLVKEYIAYAGIPIDVFAVLVIFFVGFWVLTNQSTVHSGGVRDVLKQNEA